MRLLTKVVPKVENVTSLNLLKCKQCRFHLNHQRCKGAALIDGIKRANIIQEQLKQDVSSFVEKGYNPPQLTTILVGKDDVSHVYIKRKTIAAKAVGIFTRAIELNSDITESELVNLITSLNNDSSVNGILVQLPLPYHICERKICNIISPAKDVDGFSFSNLGHFILGMDGIWPCTAMAVQDLIKSTGFETKGKHAVICGRSKNVGLPIAMLLQASSADGASGMDATTTICHRFTPHDQLCALTKSADILISATGVPGLIKSSMVKSGACVIDVGITRLYDQSAKKNRLVGDVEFDAVSKVAGFITPVPGGVGPVTVAMLLQNTMKAAKIQMGIL